MNKIEDKLIVKTLRLRKIPIELTISLLILGIFVFIFSAGTGNTGLLFFLIGIALFFPIYSVQEESIEIHLSNGRIQVYSKSLFKTTEKSFLLDDFSALRIEFSIDKPQNTATSNFGASPHWGSVQYKSFDLYLISEKKKLKIKHFVNPVRAKEFQKEFSKSIEKPILKPIRIIDKH